MDYCEYDKLVGLIRRPIRTHAAPRLWNLSSIHVKLSTPICTPLC